MTNREKAELREYAKAGYSFSKIKEMVDCSDSTIRQYIKVFAPKKEGNKDEQNNNL